MLAEAMFLHDPARFRIATLEAFRDHPRQAFDALTDWLGVDRIPPSAEIPAFNVDRRNEGCQNFMRDTDPDELAEAMRPEVETLQWLLRRYGVPSLPVADWTRESKEAEGTAREGR
ncbi:unnamed protein product [Polarella glacialis]|uniref:Uncharacterized protein n=1 Tax=Polarella glacialis TaxID=89957 RepID=A0A813G0A5_POLGL|nr:unnamed protein product [Polarella glacialis]